METYQILVIVGVGFFIIEIFIPSFIAGSIAFGFFLAALGSYFNLDTEVQLIMFSTGIILTFFTIRPLLLKYGYRSSKGVKTNQDALIGRKVRVSEMIDNKIGTGRIDLDGDVWRAKSVNDSVIEIGKMVQVIEVDSIILIVKPLN